MARYVLNLFVIGFDCRWSRCNQLFDLSAGEIATDSGLELVSDLRREHVGVIADDLPEGCGLAVQTGAPPPYGRFLALWLTLPANHLRVFHPRSTLG